MGAYLNTPIREKESIDNDSHALRYGASSMQGWRMSQEDAHNCCADFDADTNTSLFAVYDGHGGSEVAQYTAAKFPDFIKSHSLYKDNKLKEALEEGFLEFDKLLTDDEVIKELKVLAGVEEQPRDEESEDEDTETAMLCEEADMPIEKLMERYGAGSGGLPAAKLRSLRKKENIQSPAIRPQKNQPSLTDNGNDDDIKGSLEDKLVNGCSPDSAKQTTDSKPSEESESDKNEAEMKIGDTISVCSKSEPTVDCTVDSSGDKGPSEQGDGVAQVSSSSDSPGGASSCAAGSADTSETQDGCQAGSSTGRTRKARKNIIPEEGEDESSFDEDEEDTDDSEDEEDMWESASSSEDDEDDVVIGGFAPRLRDDDDEEEEDEEGGAGEGMQFMGGGGEEPGSDSGCTAVVALLRDRELYVANAGDSRCVVSRGGKAVEMSFDHKPEDTVELERITKAGGKVTADGRVNGGLNLSRALGDHLYKRNKELPLRDQMISALPDIKCLSLGAQDEFIVLACDGIWNVMSSQDVVSFVRDRISSKDIKLSSICEEMFEFCLAPDTMGDGTGCDNMTCIIVSLDNLQQNGDSNQGAKKRSADCCELETSELPQTKRQKSCDEETEVKSTES